MLHPKLLAFLVPLACLDAAPCYAQQLLWGSGDGILTVPSNGGPPTTFLGNQEEPHSMVVHQGEVYWTDIQAATPAIRRTPLLGGATTTLVVTEVPFIPIGIALDPVHERLYWTEGVLTSSDRRISRANLDGTGRETLPCAPPLVDPIGIQVDPLSERIYWADYDGHRIGHATLDGCVVPGFSSHTLFDLSPSGEPEGVALDPEEGTIYWGDASASGGPGIWSGSTDGILGPQALTTNPVENAGGVALDPCRGLLYFDSQIPAQSQWEIRSFNLSTETEGPVLATSPKQLNGTLAFTDDTLAKCASRVGSPPNPDVFACGGAGPPVVGKTWEPIIDHSTWLQGALADFCFTSGGPLNLQLGVFGTLLCDLSPPSGLFLAPAPGASFHIGIPNNCLIVGLTFCTQGGSIDANGSTQLANALDITIGTF